MALKDSIKDVLLWEDKNNAKNLGQGGIVTKPVSTPSVTQPTSQPVRQASSGQTTTQTVSAPQRNYYDELMDAINAQTKAKKDAQIAALDAQLKRGLSDYDAQISALDPIYQGYRNESEVERYKAQKALRENQANRGTFDSGLGRQEVLDLQTNYGNNLNAINMQYQSELDALNRAKQALNDEAAAQRIQIESDIENIGLENKIALMREQLAAQQNASRQAASKASSSNYSSGKSSGSSSIASNTGLQNVDKLIQKHQSMGKLPDKQGVANMISTGYSGGILNEDDVKQLAAKYGINVK